MPGVAGLVLIAAHARVRGTAAAAVVEAARTEQAPTAAGITAAGTRTAVRARSARPSANDPLIRQVSTGVKECKPRTCERGTA